MDGIQAGICGMTVGILEPGYSVIFASDQLPVYIASPEFKTFKSDETQFFIFMVSPAYLLHESVRSAGF
jgi:hypothetical protein